MKSSKISQSTGSHPEPGILMASLPVVGLILLISFGYVLNDIPIEALLVVATAIASLIALALGYSWDDVTHAIADKIAKGMPAIMILIMVGFLVGTWMASGTIPLMVYFGLKIIDPAYLALVSLFVTAIVSLCTGTSWGSAGTVGVALMGVAIGVNANLGMVAGAVVAGAYFGDKLSPLSDTTNLASIAAEVDLFQHIRHLLWTTVPSFLLSAMVFLIAGIKSHADASTPAKVSQLLSELGSSFHLGWWLLIPVVIVLVGSILRFPTIPVMLVSSIVAIALAITGQHLSLQEAISAGVNGFDAQMINLGGEDSTPLSQDILLLVNRGGMSAMMDTLLVCFCAIAFGGAFSVSGCPQVLLRFVMRGVKSTFSLIGVTVVTGVMMIAVTANSIVSMLVPGEMYRPVYISRGLDPRNLSRTLEDSAAVVEPILPWTAAGVYMAGTLGVPTLQYLPWAVSNYVAIIFALIWAATGIGIAKLK